MTDVSLSPPGPAPTTSKTTRPTARGSADHLRVLLINPEGATLLFEDSDPGLDHARWWVTPGGGIDPGETATRRPCARSGGDGYDLTRPS